MFLNLKNLLIKCFFLWLIISCADDNKLEKEIANIPVDVKVERFDQKFRDAQPSDLPELKNNYSFLFPEQFKDSLWIARMSDTLQKEIHREVDKVFPDFIDEEADIVSLLQHVKFYFPEISIPRVITVTSDVDYQRKVILSKDLLLISLDTYLGEDHYFYENIQKYLKKGFVADQLLVDIATMYTKQLVELPKSRTFLANMIYYGKEMYLKSLFLPNLEDHTLMNYRKEELQWSIANEEEIWRFFIDKQLLYKTDADLSPRFLYPAPFSKFYLQEIDQESPDRIGQYIGWQIVKAYMDNNKVSLRQMLMTDAETIFNKSKFKPRK